MVAQWKSPAFGRVAQLVERSPEKREVSGSTPLATTKCRRVVSSVGRASGLHPEGRGFEPLTAHQEAATREYVASC